MLKYLSHRRLSLYTHKYLLSLMARIILSIDEELDKQFRDEVAKRLGMKKGNIKIAMEEAIKDWIKKGK